MSLCDEGLLRSDVEWGDASLVATRKLAQRGLDAEEVSIQLTPEKNACTRPPILMRSFLDHRAAGGGGGGEEEEKDVYSQGCGA